MSDRATTPNGPDDLATYLVRFGVKGDVPPKPVLRGREGVLVTLPVPDGDHSYVYRGVLVGPSSAELVGPPAPVHGLSTLHGLTGVEGQVADLFVEATGRYLARAQELDSDLGSLGARGPNVPLAEVWRLERRAAALREGEGRALVALDEMAALPAEYPLHLASIVPRLESELERVAEFTRGVQQGLIDLVLLWNTEHSNRLAETTNELGRISNKIAELQNISNLRMLGITYIVLLLALVAAIIAIPNTAATILGMPSAAWVPGLWVDIIILVLAVIPVVVVFSRPWIRTFLREFPRYEARSSEGIGDLPERVPGVGPVGRTKGPG